MASKDKDDPHKLYVGRHRKDKPVASQEELKKENEDKKKPKSRFRLDYLDED